MFANVIFGLLHIWPSFGRSCSLIQRSKDIKSRSLVDGFLGILSMKINLKSDAFAE